VVNLPIVIIIYIAGNLTRFLFPLSGPDSPMQDRSILIKGIAYVVSTILPYLEIFDLRQQTVYSTIRLRGTQFAHDLQAIPISQIWLYTGIAVLYAITYAAFALAAGMWLFQSRELGGAEG
jgi:hypothetical protein